MSVRLTVSLHPSKAVVTPTTTEFRKQCKYQRNQDRQLRHYSLCKSPIKRSQNSISQHRISSSNAHDQAQGFHRSVLTLLLLVVVHLVLDLLNQTLLLLVVRGSRRARPDASLLVLVSDIARTADARSVGGADVACGVGAGLGGQVGGVGQRAGVGLHALALGVGVLADLLAARGGDGAGVDAVVAALFGGLQR